VRSSKTLLIPDEDSSPRRPLKKRPSPTINTKAALDDIIDIFSQPLRSQQELDEEASSSEDESDATSLTSRSFGNQSDAEEKTVAGEDNPPPTSLADRQDELMDEVSVTEISKGMARLELQPCEQYQEPVEVLPHPVPADIAPNQGFVFPMPIPPQPPIQPPAERRFNLNLMTPIEERTESTVFQHSQHSQDDSSQQSPLGTHFARPRTPSRKINFAGRELDSSPFEEYIPKPRPTILDKSKRSVLPTKPFDLKKHDTKTVGPIIKETQCNPMDQSIRQQIFDALKPAINTYDGFTGEEYHDAQRIPEIERFITKMSRKDGGVTQNLEMRIVLGGVDYAIRKKLGQGAFAPVFLAEALDTKVLRAIKVEKNPPSKWEFYLMRQAKRRLGVSRAADSMIDTIGLHLFRDESYLILEYRDQGTILDLVNSAKVSPIGESSTGVMDEILAMFLAIELVRSVENLHSKNILHGDLKADNCLVRFDESELTDSYRRDGSGGWNAKGIALIDFGRGVDMKLFPDKVQFIADWETDDQDCPEMREMRPWTFQVDYWGLAGIIHSMLYGKYITTRTEPVGMGKKRYLLKESLKRYWQQDLWKGLLEVLLNPGLVAAEEGTWPITHKLKECRGKMEAWLEENSERGVGLRGIIRRIEMERKAGR
jgi:checkpoint serine/threonine-protein kinase